MVAYQNYQQFEKGIPYSRFPGLAKLLGISETQLRNLMGISAPTLHRRKVDGRFSLEESNQLYRLESLYRLAEQVFDGAQEAREWLSHPNMALGGRVPLDLVHIAPGYEHVQRLLHQLDEGVVV